MGLLYEWVMMSPIRAADPPVVGDGPQRVAGGTVAAAAQPVSVRLPAAGLDWADTAERGEGCVAMEPLGVPSGCDEELGGAVDPDSRSLDQRGSGAVDEITDHPIELKNLLVKLQPSPTEAGQRGMLAVDRGELAASGGQLQQALYAHLVAKLLVGAD